MPDEPGPALRVMNLLARGPVPYREAWDLQRRLVTERQADAVPDTLILLEHPPTVTYGKAADPRFRLLSDEEYAVRGIDLIPSDRGGDVTYHGPGQLVGYPILHLGEGKRDLHRYVRALEDILIQSVADLGVPGAGQAPWHAGVWVGDGYLAALGVRVARWVTHHGFALNVTDAVLPGFATIVPCGVLDKPVVTLSGLASRPVTVAEAAEAVVARFATTFGYGLAQQTP
jgi:lipoyl(octanoyl) transferase